MGDAFLHLIPHAQSAVESGGHGHSHSHGHSHGEGGGGEYNGVSKSELGKPNAIRNHNILTFGFPMAKNKMATILFKTVAILFGLKRPRLTDVHILNSWNDNLNAIDHHVRCSVFEPQL